MKIQNDAEYEVAVKEMDTLLDKEGEKILSPEDERLIELANAVEAYDDIHFNPPFGDMNNPNEG